MEKINADHLVQYIKTLESSLEHLNKSEPESIDYEVFRNATVKGFELTLETSGKLLRRVLKAYTACCAAAGFKFGHKLLSIF
jgi:hypothetical protein